MENVKVHVVIDDEIKREKVLSYLKKKKIPLVDTSGNPNVFVIDFIPDKDRKKGEEHYVIYKDDCYLMVSEIRHINKRLKLNKTNPLLIKQ